MTLAEMREIVALCRVPDFNFIIGRAIIAAERDSV